MKTKLLVTSMACVSLLVGMSGCAGVTRHTPHAGTQIQANMNSGDCQVLAKTEGNSKKTSILCGLVQVIDGDKVAVLGIKFFEDQYSYFEHAKLFGVIDLGGVSVEDRAYYKALAATPDADTVAQKAYVKTEKSIPLFWKSEDVTFQGKALKFKGGN